MAETNLYRAQWDSYVKHWRGQPAPDGSGPERTWPGDEWGHERVWTKVFQVLFADGGVHEWRHCVEIGAGSGKYTERVLRSSEASVTAFDISSEFLAILKQRLSADVASGRIDPVLIQGQQPSELFKYIEKKQLVRQLDAFYSIDAMVHVDLQYLIAYILTAALTLKQNGRLLLTLANAVSDRGFAHLMRSIKPIYPRQGLPSSKFEFLSPEIVRDVLGRLGFTVELVTPFASVQLERDIYVRATLSDLAPGESFREALF
jgi:SAM-dependent methyltransferase